MTYFEQSLQFRGLFVPQIEQTVTGVVGVQTQFGAVLAHPALGPHHEGFSAPVAKFVLALGAGEMHAAPASQGVPKFTLRAVDAILGEVFGDCSGLILGVVGVLPLCEFFATYTFVLLFPLELTL